MEELLKKIIEKNRMYTKLGQVASYIPELRKARRDDLGICIVDCDNNVYTAGDYDKVFTIQSISKPILLSMILMENDFCDINKKVGFEQSNNPFNSIVSIGDDIAKKPYNPMMNSGAIVITSMVKGNNEKEKEEKILNYFKKFSGNENLEIDNNVYLSEKRTGDRNRAMAYLLKSDGFIDEDVDVDNVLDLYFKQCSIKITTKDLAVMGLNLAMNCCKTSSQIINRDVSKIVKTIMFTCGLYDGTGDFLIRTGMASKSGVGGGIMATVNGRLGIGVYGPSLDEKGNSIAGIKILEDLSKELDLGIF